MTDSHKKKSIKLIIDLDKIGKKVEGLRKIRLFSLERFLNRFSYCIIIIR